MNAIDTILKHEGGFVNDPADPGGATFAGITQATLSAWRGYQVTVDEVRNMTVDEARVIYENKYLRRPKIDQLPNPPQDLILDMAVNHGPFNGVRMMQRVINQAGVVDPISTDGKIGPNTIRSARATLAAMGPYFQNAIVDERIRFYKAIVKRRPSSRKFLRGWLNRAESFRLSV